MLVDCSAIKIAKFIRVMIIITIIMNTTISITKELQEEIREFGTKGETYDQILRRILESTKERQLQELLMDEEDCILIEDALKRAKAKWLK